jgi:hypothetical protein
MARLEVNDGVADVRGHDQTRLGTRLQRPFRLRQVAAH